MSVWTLGESVLYLTIIPRRSCCCCPGFLFLFSVSHQMLYSCFILQGEGRGVHRKAPAATCKVSVASCPDHRSPPITSAEPGESQPGGGRAADLGDWSNRGPVLVHPRSEKKQQPLFAVSLSTLVLVVRALCSSSSRLLAFNSGTQPTVEYHLLALQAPSTRYSCKRRWSRETVSSRLQPMSLHVCILQTGSCGSAWHCQFSGLMKYCPGGEAMA